jgi:hypothetical protein
VVHLRCLLHAAHGVDQLGEFFGGGPHQKVSWRSSGAGPLEGPHGRGNLEGVSWSVSPGGGPLVGVPNRVSRESHGGGPMEVVP